MDAEGLQDLFAPIGPARVKRMFGGYGVYLDGVIVAVCVQGEVMLKGDATTAPELEAAGGRRWTYEQVLANGKVKRGAMPYWTLPETCYDDEDALKRFVRLALDASRRVEAAKAKRAPVRARGGD